MSGGASRPIVLVGMMGTGKSIVGEALSRRLEIPFVDLDEVIERRDGRSVQEIFAEEGESRFRQLESQSLGDILASTDSPFVLATGGGVVTISENRDLLIDSPSSVVLLEASIDELARRLAGDRSRPLLAGDVHTALQSLWTAREAQYREVSDVVVSTDGHTVDEVADLVIKATVKAA